MNYPSIRIEGSILSHDILERVEDMPGQKPIDFGFDSSSKVKDEIARAWADAQDYWRIFQRKLDNLKPDSAATTETRQQWIVPLLGLLGYQLEYQPKGADLNGKIYNISHIATNRSQAPVQIIGYREPAGLDRKPERSKLRMSAHAIVQEFLNLNDQLYGLVTNGRVLRLLRDSSRLIKLSYLEFDLDRIFTDGLFADFAILYRLLHATRLPVTNDSAGESLIERYHQDTIEQGTRIRDGLRAAVTEALEILGTGFVAHADNLSLREQIDVGSLGHAAFFSHLLRLIYRLLFLNVVEERGLIFPKDTPASKLRTYFDYYSVQRLRRLARTRGLKTERHHDAWLSLLSTFQLFENTEQAAKLGTTAFDGQLFDSRSLGPLSSCRLANASLFDALDRLCSFDDPKSGQRLPVNFGALATEEFGSVYEGLLELHPVIETAPLPRFSFLKAAGNDRKTSGSYYTPTSLVDCLLDSALDPVLSERIHNHKALGYNSAEAAILSLRVCDPACGSGHFLIAASQRIARKLAQIRAGDDEPSPDQLRHALRQVIGRCIYAVDVNPMSVELCRVALWLEAVEPGKPLSFLDHHLRVGNSLLGTTPELLAAGIPTDAFTAIDGDDKKACAVLKKRNKNERAGLGPLFAQQDAEIQARLQQASAVLEQLPDDRPEHIRAKELAFHHHEQTEEYLRKKLLADTWCAAFVIRKHFSEPGRESSVIGITQANLTDLAEGRPLASHLQAEVENLSRQYQFFHWHLAFPEVFARGGFDCVLGNPPWEMVEFSEKEFFSQRAPPIANAASARQRQALILKLEDDDPALWRQFCNAKRLVAGARHFIQTGGRFARSSVGRINLYPLFTEAVATQLHPSGRAGIIVPSAISMDAYNAALFGWLLQGSRLVSFFDFENAGALFPSVHRSYRFCLLTLAGEAGFSQDIGFCYFAHAVEELRDPKRRITLSLDDILGFSPNTLAPPILQCAQDKAISTACYRRYGVFLDRRAGKVSAWKPSIQRMLSLSDDSDFFRRREELPETIPDGFSRLYSGKTIHAFNHRFATFDGADWRPITSLELSDPAFVPVTEYYARVDEIDSRLSGKSSSGWLFGYRDIARATDERTSIAAIIPRTGCDTHCRNVYVGVKDQSLTACLMANMNAFAFDYLARQKIIGTGMGAGVLEQLPIIPPTSYSVSCSWSGGHTAIKDWLMPRVLELTYTAWDLHSFAQDCGASGPPFRWDEERRFMLRCELDAAFLHLYLPTQSNGDWHSSDGEMADNLALLKSSFPIPRDAVAYVMETFPIVKRKDEAKFDGDYRTKRVILEIYDALAESFRNGQPYQTRLTPPPGAIECRHPRKKIGVLAYGSLIDDPGPELAPNIIMRLKTLTPFPVEYARISSGTRSGAPTLVRHDSGCPVSAEILVLDDDVSVDDAKSLLWRRETRKTGGEKYSEGTSPNSVLVRVIDTPSVISVLHTDFRDEGKIANPTPDDLAKRAIESVGKAVEGRDGISYLINAIAKGIQTPLTSSYCQSILKQTNTASLEEALLKVKKQLVREEKATA